ncbi:MAG: hypothetical protein HC897_11105 [Thermoanaerobaculia bacterium]|nr:hypothetical protein [Thermoanaerobaculia bacterium]
MASRSCLRYSQRRLPEALELADQAMELLAVPQGRLAVQILMTRAQVYSAQGLAERALPDLFAAAEALGTNTDVFLLWLVRQNLASGLWRLGRIEEAESWLGQARVLAAELAQRAPWYHTLWLEGLIADHKIRLEVAAIQLREVCMGFRGSGSWGHFAVAALDLARIEARRGCVDEAIVWAVQALPHLQALELESEGLAALALVREQVAAKQLRAAVLEPLRRAAGRAVGAPELQG